MLLSASNRFVGVDAWSEISIYETIYHRYAAAVSHHVPDELGLHWVDAALIEDVDGVRSMLRAHDPLTALPSLPAWGEPSNLGSLLTSIGSSRLQQIAVFRARWLGLVCGVTGISPGDHGERPGAGRLRAQSDAIQEPSS